MHYIYIYIYIQRNDIKAIILEVAKNAQNDLGKNTQFNIKNMKYFVIIDIQQVSNVYQFTVFTLNNINYQ